MKKRITLLFLILGSMAFGWTSREEVVEASGTMLSKTTGFESSISASPKYQAIIGDVKLLEAALTKFQGLVAAGVTEEEAGYEYERLSGVYSHANNKVSAAVKWDPLAYVQWLDVNWAWKELATNMYGTVP